MLNLWLTLIVIGLITFAYRFSLIFFLEYIQLPGWLRQSLRFVPIAALTAITVPEVLVRSGALTLTWQNERLLAALVAAVVAWRTKNIFLTIALGMVSLYALQRIGW
ncbi:MAG: AzlD domain-containing protein [Caldilineaceae bacterium]